MLYAFILIVCFLLTSAHADDSTGYKGLLVIPGLGRSDRIKTVIHNLNLLEADYLTGPSPSWDCIVYIYSPRNDTDFWKNKKELSYITRLCDIVEHPNKRVTENLYLVQPVLIQRTYDYVFILLDDCKLIGKKSFELNKMIRIMEHNELTVASPMVVGANIGGGQKFRTIMQTEAQPGTEGYVSSFVEIFAWVVTANAYRALWQLLYPFVNPYGWGYDFWYDNFAKTRVQGHKMGIISTVKVKHEQDFSLPSNGRTDTASVEMKWQAILEQEKHYKAYLDINLKKCREGVDLKNSSWNGAVIGYLQSPSPDTASVLSTQVKVKEGVSSGGEAVSTGSEGSLKKTGPKKGAIKKKPGSMKAGGTRGESLASLFFKGGKKKKKKVSTGGDLDAAE